MASRSMPRAGNIESVNPGMVESVACRGEFERSSCRKLGQGDPEFGAGIDVCDARALARIGIEIGGRCGNLVAQSNGEDGIDEIGVAASDRGVRTDDAGVTPLLDDFLGTFGDEFTARTPIWGILFGV